MDYSIQDLESVKDLMGDGFPKLVQTYVKNMTLYTDNIVQGFTQQDAEMIKNSAHPLKSSSRNLCNMRLADISESLEHKSRKIMDGELSFDDIIDEVKKIPIVAEETRAVLSEYL